MKKSSYATPAIKVVAFQVEEGFQNSPYKAGSWRTVDGQIEITNPAVQDFDVINIDQNTGSASGWGFRD